MYESLTAEEILADMISRTKNDFDKREGSFFYDALAPSAHHISKAYFALDNYMDLIFADTSVEGYLDRVAADYGLTREVGESDDALRSRIKEGIVNPPQGWNVAQYKKTAIEFEGIGTAKVFPLWNGGNTVKIAITNKSNLPADSVLVTAFQNYIDPGASGLGNGVALIGSKVTVTGGTPKNISITGNIVLSTGYTEPTGAEEAVAVYLASLVYAKSSVSYMKLGSILLDCSSISELSNLTINGGTGDIALIGEEIPVLISLNLMVVM